MEQIVRVNRVLPDGRAEIIHVRESACSGDCHKCSGCGAAKETMLITAENPIKAERGDFVTMSSDSGQVLGMAMILYVIPLVLFFAGYAVGEALAIGGALVGCLSFAAGVALAVVADRRIAKKNKTVYTITGYAPGQGKAYQ